MTLASAHAAERRRSVWAACGASVRAATTMALVAGLAAGGLFIQREVVRDQFGFDIGAAHDWRKLQFRWSNGYFSLDTPRRWYFAGSLFGGAAAVAFTSIYFGVRGPAAIGAVAAASVAATKRTISGMALRHATAKARRQIARQVADDASARAGGRAGPGSDRSVASEAGSPENSQTASIVDAVRRLSGVDDKDIKLLANQQIAFASALDREVADAKEAVRTRTEKDYGDLARANPAPVPAQEPPSNSASNFKVPADADSNAADTSVADTSAADATAPLGDAVDSSDVVPASNSTDRSAHVDHGYADPDAGSAQAGPTTEVGTDSFFDEKLRAVDSILLMLGKHGAVTFAKGTFGCDIVCLLGGDLVLIRVFTNPGDYSAEDTSNIPLWIDINTQASLPSPADALLSLQTSLVGVLGARLANNGFGVRSLLCLAGRARLVEGLADFWETSGLQIVDASPSGICGDDLLAIETAFDAILRSGRKHGVDAREAIDAFIEADGFVPSRAA
jgi:hypothetical protein